MMTLSNSITTANTTTTANSTITTNAITTEPITLNSLLDDLTAKIPITPVASNNSIYCTSNNSIYHFAYCKELDITAPYITKVEVLKPGKVLRFTFNDNTIIKTICIDNDTFDFKFAFFLAYAKYFYSNILTVNGIETKAKSFMDIKFFNSLVKKGMKTYFKQKKEEEKIEKEKAERKEIEKRRAEKKEYRKTKIREAKIEEMAEAIKRANSK